ncbi:MAG: winged helix DNA-binding domain-containing protein [Actinobacteria bacterium]|nr:winged helix DNA-binding domain-containing protein [Actinomycetota bacterium]
MKPLTLRELNRATLARQLLLRREQLGVPEAVERLGALQAQRPRAPYVALAARLDGFQREDLSRALHDRAVVRATLMRETLHLVTAADYPHDAAAMAQYFRTLRAQYLPEGVTMERVVELAGHAAAALAEPLEATALRPRLAELEAQIADDRVWRRVRTNAPILHVPGDELHAFGVRNRFVSAAAWLGAVEAEEAEGLRRLVRRYLGAYGPSTRADVAAWTGLAVATVAPALHALGPDLERLRDERGRELFDLRGAARPPEETPAPLRLLGEWDNVLLAHADRTRMFDDETRRLVIRKNGDVVPTILVDGFVAGTWWWKRRRDVSTLQATPFVKLTKAARAELEREAALVLPVLEPAASRFEVELLDQL